MTPELIARHDRPGPRYTSYPTAIEFDERRGPADHASSLAELGRSGRPLSLYVHLPFCRTRCSFCACHVVVTGNQSLADRYLAAVEREATTLAEHLGSRPVLTQYHWGGGTPTYHDPDALRRLHERIVPHFDIDPDAEVAAEVDPRVTSSEHLELLADLGFNRLSLGVQDMDGTVQEMIGRGQTPEQTVDLVEAARGLGFRSVNLDLIYGLPGQTDATMADTLERVLEIRPERLAVYSFAYVPWMRPHQRRIDEADLPDRDTKFALLARLVSTLTSSGYSHIGMDHFALADDDLTVAARNGSLTRNFMGYTTGGGTDVVALGTSGISDVDGAYAQNHRRLSTYLEAAEAGELPVERGIAPSHDDRIRRWVINRVMCTAAVDLAEAGERFGVDGRDYFADELERLAAAEGLVAEGMATVDGSVVRATEVGALFIRRLAMLFDVYLPGRMDRPRFSRVV